MDAVDKLHAELKFEDVVTELRVVSGVWNKLELLQRRARRDAAVLPEYKKFLTRCITSVLSDPVLTEGEAAKAHETYMQTYASLATRLNLPDIQARRLPYAWEEWMQRQGGAFGDVRMLPLYDDYKMALGLVAERPTTKAFARLTKALEAAMCGYATAISG